MSAPPNASHKRWLPLEANPEVMTHFCGILGLDITQHSFSDVYGLDPDMLSFIPGPVRAILLLFPTGAQAEQFKQEEERRIEQEGQILSEKVYFMKQNIGNACGTIALLHSIFNNMDRLKIKDDSFLSRFYELSIDMTPFQRAELLENPKEDQPDIEKAHEEAASAGDTQPPPLEEKVNLHFVALVEKEGGLYELDGHKKFPIYHGPTSEVSLLSDAVPVILEFMNRTESIEFSRNIRVRISRVSQMESFLDIQNKLIDARTRQKQLILQTRAKERSVKECSLVADQLNPLPSETRMFKANGRAYFLMPRVEVLEELEKVRESNDKEITSLKSGQTKLETEIKEIEQNLREVLKNNPALAAQIMAEKGPTTSSSTNQTS